jgi:hypothetical protein
MFTLWEAKLSVRGVDTVHFDPRVQNVEHINQWPLTGMQIAECHSVSGNFLLQNAIFTTYTRKHTYSSVLQPSSEGFANALEIEQVVPH